ncbi:MAG: hypothetical protein S4CHLAM45_13100 [Chlamydiales bacterium]|nr:hypothetical protein [Chlamydiales bacterium]MCH9619799.1 hypothetical protein [Chlamydiales bacterium]MCH9623405.1 hypothetical protein [Chlamydiales bacterium]
MKKSFITKEKLPLVIEPEKSTPTFEQFLKYVEENREEISQLVVDHAGVLFRGFPIVGAEGFNAVIKTLNLGKALDYVGGDSPRDKVKGKVYTSTEAPPSLKIPLHNEMSFIKDYPKHIYFYCQTPSPVGGATILGDARRIYDGVKSDVQKRFTEGKLRYVSNYYGKSILFDLINKLQRGHKTWMEAFETESRLEAEKRCDANAFDYKWNGDWLQVSQTCPAILDHPVTGEPTWFNQAHLYDFNPKLIGFWNWIGTKLIYAKPNTIMHEIFFETGGKIPKQDLYHILDVLDDQTISYPWQEGDFLVLDNVLAMHGRAPFEGKRKILTALTR